MFTIQGQAVFTEDDMLLGDKLEETLKNEGFAVNKDFRFNGMGKDAHSIMILSFYVQSDAKQMD